MLANDAEAEIVRHQNPLILAWNTTVAEAACQMERHHVSAVLVIEAAVSR